MTSTLEVTDLFEWAYRRIKVIVRKVVIALSVATCLAGSVRQSQADAMPVPVVAGTTATAGLWVTGSFLGVVAVLCAYDLIQKAQGLKNWDGSAKVLKAKRH
jgi:hypothetical protein